MPRQLDWMRREREGEREREAKPVGGKEDDTVLQNSLWRLNECQNQMSSIKRDIRSPLCNADYPLVFHTDHFPQVPTQKKVDWRRAGLFLTMWGVCVTFLALASLSSGDTDTHRPRHDSNLQIYKRLFETKRRDQLNALKNLVELNDINQQYKIIDIMLKGLFKVLEDSKEILVSANMQPNDPFPLEDKIKEAYSHIVENTAFFGDVALRFPRIVHHYFDRNADWGGLLRWGLNFCNQTGVFTGGAHQHVLTLMSQELGITEKSPDFINPYRTERDDVLHTAEAFQKILREEEKRRRKEEKRKEIRKGPRISRSRSEL